MKYSLNIQGEPSELAAILLIASENEAKGAAEEPQQSAEAPKAAKAEKAEKAPEPEPEPSKGSGIPTFEDLRNAAMAAINAGKRDEVEELLKGAFGVRRVTELPESERAAFLVEVEKL